MSIAVTTLMVLLATPVDSVRSAPENSDSTMAHRSLSDPAQNRLFTMSTGMTMPKGKFSFTDFEFLLLQLGYAPTGFAQFNVSYIIPLMGSMSYWSIGTKFQIFPSVGYFKGLAVGADVGYFNRLFEISMDSESPHLVATNIAVSFGTDIIAGHINLVQHRYSSTSSTIPFPTYVQIGTDIVIERSSDHAGVKLVLESFLTRARGDLEFSGLLLGFRAVSPTLVAEFAWPFTSVGRSTTSSSLQPAQFPYASIAFLF